MADLITVTDYKQFLGIDPTNTRDDVRIAALLPAASAMIRAYTDRDFGVSAGGATTRDFQYDGSGFLDINDATSIISVATNAGVLGQSFALEDQEWTAQPQGGPVFYYLLVHGGPYGGLSPQMGFKRNLDQYEWYPKPPTMSVTGVWGWADVPADVKLAAAWTVQDALARDGGGGPLQSESIAGYSRSWAVAPSGAGGMLSIPNRARDILANYERAY